MTGADVRALRMLVVVLLAGLGVTACVKPPPPPRSVTLADLNGSFTGTTVLGGGCPVRLQTFDAEYKVHNAAKKVVLHIEGCIDPNIGSYGPGTFTIDTKVGTLRGTASGPVDTSGFDYDLELEVTSGTGQFQAERGTAHVSIHWTPTIGGGPITGSFMAD